MFINEIERETFLKSFQLVIGIVERKQPLPILSNVLIKKANNKISFVATDLEIQMESHTEFDNENTNTAITVSAKNYKKLLGYFQIKVFFH